MQSITGKLADSSSSWKRLKHTILWESDWVCLYLLWNMLFALPSKNLGLSLISA
jgi:hypothetical protein